MTKTPLTEDEKKIVRDAAINQFDALSKQLGGLDDVLPKKYWLEYAGILANSALHDDEITPDDIINFLQTKGSIIDSVSLASAYNTLLTGTIIAGLKIKYKDEWPRSGDNDE